MIMFETFLRKYLQIVGKEGDNVRDILFFLFGAADDRNYVTDNIHAYVTVTCIYLCVSQINSIIK